MSRLQLALLVVALVAGGAALRWRHLSTPSLWWDELVEIRTAERRSVVEVLGAVRDGAAPGTGNAGAMPLDYLALHAWSRIAPVLLPETLELRYRIPSFAFAVAALPLAWLAGSAAGGPSVAAAMLALVATSLPLLLYAAEVRPYSAFAAAGMLGLLGFLRLLDDPGDPRRIVAWTAASLVSVFTMLYGVFPLAAQAGALVLAMLGTDGADRRTRRVVPATLLAGALVVVALLAWLGTGAFGTVYVRPKAQPESPWQALLRVVDFFAGRSRLLAAAMFTGLAACVPAAFGRDPRDRVLARAILATVLALAAAVWVARSQNYYLHPRHAFFLLPSMLLALAVLVGRGTQRLVPGWSAAGRAGFAAATALVLAAAPVRSFLEDPLPAFRQVKTLRDFRGLAREIALRSETLDRTDRMVVVTETRRPGHLANPVLAFYLAAWGIGGRTVLRGSGDPARTLERLAALGAPGDAADAEATAAALGVGDPFTQSLSMRMLLGMPLRPLPQGRVRRIAVVAWGASASAPEGLASTTGDGWTLFEPAPR